MATTYRRRHNLLTNTLGATLATGATSITFASALQEGGSNIATLGTDEYLTLTIGSEVVYLTAYTAGATSGTIARAKENTVDPGTTYANGTAVTHAPTKRDVGSGLVTSKPAANITRSSTTLGALSTAWTVAVTAAADQVVRVEACIVAHSAVDENIYVAIAKGGTVLISAVGSYPADGRRTGVSTLVWVDESPSVGTNTYEVYVASNGGNQVTVGGGNSLSTSPTLTGNGNSVLTAEARLVGS